MKTVYVTENVGQNCATFDLGRKLYSVIAMRNAISNKGIIGKIDFDGVTILTPLFFEGFFSEALSNFTFTSLKDAFCFNNLTINQYEMVRDALYKCAKVTYDVKKDLLANSNNKAISEIMKQLAILLYDDKVEDKEQIINKNYNVNSTSNIKDVVDNLDEISDFIFNAEENEHAITDPFSVIKIDKISVSDLNRWRNQTDELLKNENAKLDTSKTKTINKLAENYIEDFKNEQLNNIDKIMDIITETMCGAITDRDLLIIKHKLMNKI